VLGEESEADIPFAGLLGRRARRHVLDRMPEPCARVECLASVGWCGRLIHHRAVTLSLLTAKAEQAPLLVLIDDVQWLDHLRPTRFGPPLIG
jgi:hypothetical protein